MGVSWDGAGTVTGPQEILHHYAFRPVLWQTQQNGPLQRQCDFGRKTDDVVGTNIEICRTRAKPAGAVVPLFLRRMGQASAPCSSKSSNQFTSSGLVSDEACGSQQRCGGENPNASGNTDEREVGGVFKRHPLSKTQPHKQAVVQIATRNQGARESVPRNSSQRFQRHSKSHRGPGFVTNIASSTLSLCKNKVVVIIGSSSFLAQKLGFQGFQIVFWPDKLNFERSLHTRENRLLLRSMCIKAHFVFVHWPTGSWSHALRSTAQPWGDFSNAHRLRKQLHSNNQTMGFLFSLTIELRRLGIPGAFLHSQTSKVWDLPIVRILSKHPEINFAKFEWWLPKRPVQHLQLLSWHAFLLKRFDGETVSGIRATHTQLRFEKFRALRESQSETYPSSFVEALVSLIIVIIQEKCIRENGMFARSL